MSKPESTVAKTVDALLSKASLSAERSIFHTRKKLNQTVEAAKAEAADHDAACKKVERAIAKAHDAARTAADDAEFEKFVAVREALKVELEALEEKSPASKVREAQAALKKLESSMSDLVRDALGKVVAAGQRRVEDVALAAKKEAADFLALRKALMAKGARLPVPDSDEESSLYVLLHGEPLEWVASRSRVKDPDGTAAAQLPAPTDELAAMLKAGQKELA